MKTQKFSEAINKRTCVRFFYGAQEMIVEPYMISYDKFGRKILYGRRRESDAIVKYEYRYISNIRVLTGERFAPAIPILPLYS
jgi:hypothetical protein